MGMGGLILAGDRGADGQQGAADAEPKRADGTGVPGPSLPWPWPAAQIALRQVQRLETGLGECVDELIVLDHAGFPPSTIIVLLLYGRLTLRPKVGRGPETAARAALKAD
jgi:hypothetical protein